MSRPGICANPRLSYNRLRVALSEYMHEMHHTTVNCDGCSTRRLKTSQVVELIHLPLNIFFVFLREGGCNLLNKETDVLSDKGTAEFAGKDAFAIELQHPMPVSISSF